MAKVFGEMKTKIEKESLGEALKLAIHFSGFLIKGLIQSHRSFYKSQKEADG